MEKNMASPKLFKTSCFHPTTNKRVVVEPKKMQTA